MEIRDFTFTDLSLGDNTRPFDGMAAGRFIDMWGRETVFLPEELPDYVRNTKLALASTMDANGAVVGFPIDGMNHDGGLAAGWIIDVNLSDGRSVIEFTPRWNDRGRGSIGADEMRFFSPTIDVEAKVIIGGSLTNWPATRTSDHQILLRPVELSTQMQTYGEAPAIGLLASIEAMVGKLRALVTGRARPAKINQPSGGDPVEESVIENIPEAVTTTEPMAEELASPVTLSSLPAVPAVIDLASAEVQSMIMQRAEEQAAILLAEREHAAAIVNLATRLTGGTPDNPQGLSVGYDRLVAFLQSVPVAMYPEAEAILTAAAERDPISFAEMGHSRVIQGTTPLPSAIKPILRAWLAAGSSLEKFFEANSVELGNMSDYNLIEFAKEGK